MNLRSRAVICAQAVVHVCAATVAWKDTRADLLKRSGGEVTYVVHHKVCGNQFPQDKENKWLAGKNVCRAR